MILLTHPAVGRNKIWHDGIVEGMKGNREARGCPV